MPGTGREQSATSSSLEIHLLGNFRVLVDGEAVDERRFTPSQTQASNQAARASTKSSTSS
jgi:hypothetical protein